MHTVNAENAEDCSTCRFHSRQPRAKPIEEAGDELVVFDDVDEQVYVCRAAAPAPHADLEIGLTPTHCAAWQKTRPVNGVASQLLAQWEERMARRSDRER